jgi:hypothetical protein
VERVKAKMKLNKIEVERRKQKKVMLKRKMVAENRGFGAKPYILSNKKCSTIVRANAA